MFWCEILNLEGRCLALITMLISWAVHCTAFIFFFSYSRDQMEWHSPLFFLGAMTHVTRHPKTEMTLAIDLRRFCFNQLHTTMVGCWISPDRKLCALNLWDHGWEIEDICFAMMISCSSLFHWWRIFAEHGSVTHPQVSIMGLKQIINRAVLTAIQDIYQEDSDLCLDELCTLLAAEH